MATTTQPAVGSRVVVAGKEALGVATLRFIGTTKFRPGVWAGLEFPSAVGKNDGSVEGTRYFSCPQDHGMFVPAENLIVQQPPEPAATLSSSGGGEPAVGSVVVVAGKEALGAGVLRFCGPTKFRDGVWAGIEYPSAVGKNDGSVEGTRYFSCPPDHGVFVPVKSVIVQACRGPEPSTPARSTTPTPSTPAAPSTPKTPSAGASAVAPATPQPSQATAADEEPKSVGLSAHALQAEIQHLKGVIDELKEARGELQESNKSLHRELHTANEQLAAEKKLREAEQKKAESERAKLVKEHERAIEKLTALKDKEIATLQERVEELKENSELVSMDLELAEEKLRDLETEKEQLSVRVQILEATQSQLEQAAQADDDPNAKLKEAMAQNERLKEALMKLRDLSLSEKQDADQRIKTLQRQAALVPGLEERVLKLETDLLTAEEKVDELKEQLDVALEAEEIVEGLTETNERLEQELEEAKAAVEDLEQMQEIAKEIEETQAQTEKDLRSQLYTKEIHVADLEVQLNNLSLDLKDRDATIAQFRDRMKRLQSELYQFKSQQEAAASESEKISSKTHSMLNELHTLRARVSSIEKNVVDASTKRLEAESATMHLNLCKTFLPETAKKDMDLVQCLMLFHRLDRKIHLAWSILQRQFGISSDASQFVELSTSAKVVGAGSLNQTSIIDARLVAYRTAWLLRNLSKEVELFTAVMRNAEIPTDQWLALAGIQWEVARGETVLDQLLDTLRDQNFNESYSTAELQGVYEQYTVVRRAVWNSVSQGEQAEQRNRMIELTHMLDSISFAVNLAVLEHQRVMRSVSVNAGDGSAQALLHELAGIDSVTARTNEVLEQARALSRSIRSLGYSDGVVQQVAQLTGAAESIVAFARRAAEMFDEELEQLANSSASSTEQLRDLLQRSIRQALDSAPLVALPAAPEVPKDTTDDGEEHASEQSLASDSTPSIWQESLSAMEQVARWLVACRSQLDSDAASAVTHTVPQAESRNRAFEARAAWLKQELGAAAGLRSQVTALEAQARDLLSSLNAKEKALVEAGRKQTMLEGKISSLQNANDEAARQVEEARAEVATQAKQWEHALVSMQEDINTLELEKKQLQERFAAGLEEGSLHSSGSGIGIGGAAHRAGMSLIADEAVSALHQALRSLTRENATLRRVTASYSLAQLPPLARPRDKSAQITTVLAECTSELSSVRQKAMLLAASPVMASIVAPSTPKLPTPLRQRGAELAVLQRELQHLQANVQTRVSHAITAPAISVERAVAEASASTYGKHVGRVRIAATTTSKAADADERRKQLRSLILGASATRSQPVSLQLDDFAKIQSVFVQ